MLGRIFKAYDIRGTYPDLLNDTMAWQIGFGASKFLLGEAKAAGDTTPMMRNVVVGRDMRKSSPALSSALMAGITAQGGQVIDVGLVDTPFVYFAVNHLDCAGGIMCTASHNPPQYNGFKISKRKARPVGEQTGLVEIRKHAAMVDKATVQPAGGKIEKRDLWEAYRAHVRSFLDLKASSKLKVVVDASNAIAGLTIPKIFGKKGSETPGLSIVEMNFDHTSGVFAHEPNPLVAANLESLRAAVAAEKADLGLCFDGDADRCILVDEKGGIVGCDHLTALMARHMLARAPGLAVVYDLRSSKAVEEEIKAAGGVPVRSRVGHVFMKQNLAAGVGGKGGLFGGELSGHFYFRDNFNADSGVIAMAVVLSILSRSGKTMSQLIAPIARYAQSGEINFEIEDKDGALKALKDDLGGRAKIDELDGVTIDAFSSKGWWINVRKSNTEPLLRLNAEARDKATLAAILSQVSPKLGRRVEH